jgi:hypothetical protein
MITRGHARGEQQSREKQKNNKKALQRQSSRQDDEAVKGEVKEVHSKGEGGSKQRHNSVQHHRQSLKHDVTGICHLSLIEKCECLCDE